MTHKEHRQNFACEAQLKSDDPFVVSGACARDTINDVVTRMSAMPGVTVDQVMQVPYQECLLRLGRRDSCGAEGSIFSQLNKTWTSVLPSSSIPQLEIDISIMPTLV